MAHPRKILVTGGAGFIGSHLVEHLLKEGHQVFALDDLSGGYIENIPHGAHFIQLDLRDREGTERMIKQVRPDIIYHMAADATEGRSQFTPIECTSRNYTSYLNLLIPAIKVGFEKMVMASSMSIYGAQEPPFHEGMEPQPEDIYAIAKAAMEKATQILSKVHGFRYTILRPHNVYGPKQNLADPYRNVVGIFMNCVLRDKQFYIYGDGEQKRSFSYIDDQTPSIARAGFDTACDGECINIGPTQEYTINELAKAVLEVSGAHHLTPHYLPARPQEVKYAWSTNDKARKLLGYEDNISFKEGVRRMWEWAKARGPMQPKYMDSLELETADVPRTWKEKLI